MWSGLTFTFIWIGSPYLASLIPLLHQFSELSKLNFEKNKDIQIFLTITKAVSCCKNELIADNRSST